eukprot:2128804-Amphidinium_carterae.1
MACSVCPERASAPTAGSCSQSLGLEPIARVTLLEGQAFTALGEDEWQELQLSLIHISEPTRPRRIS